MAEGRLEEVADGHCGKAILLAACFKPDEVFLRQLNLGRVFDNEHSFLMRNEFPQDRKQGRFSSASSTTNKDVFACQDVVFEVVREGAIKRTFTNQIFHFEVAGVELADGERHTTKTARRDDRGDSASIGQPRVENGL